MIRAHNQVCRVSKGATVPSIFFNAATLPHGRRTPSASWRLLPKDFAVLSKLGNFSRSVAIGAAKRCSSGFPQVLISAPLKKSSPFPTTFWLVCPYLARRIGSLESRNGVDSMEEILRRGPQDWIEYHKMHARLRLSLLSSGRKRFLRSYRRSAYEALRRGGVGGMFYQGGDFFVKCLHLQAASYLAVGRHPAADWLEESISSWECGESLCSASIRRI